MILILNGHEMQLGNSAISQTFQVNDLAELKDRQSGHSNNIKVPRTPHNERVFEMLGVHSDSRLHTKKLHAKIIDNGIEIVPNGYAIVRGVGKDYNVVVYDGIISLQEVLGDKTLRSLDYSELNHYVSSENFENGISHTEGYVNALADFGVGLAIDFMPASIYVHTIWDKIFTKVGFTYSGSIFDTDKFKELVVPPSTGFDVIPYSHQELGSITSDVLSMTVERQENDFVEVEEDFTFSSQSLSDFVSAENLEIKILKKGIYNLKVEVADLVSDECFFIDITCYVNGVAQSISGAPLWLKENDVISFKISVKGIPVENRGGNSGINNGDIFDNLGCEISRTIITTLSLKMQYLHRDLFIDYSKMMPHLLQKDFIKDIMQRFGLVMIPRKNNKKHYEFVTIEELLNDRINIENWSSKYISHSESYEVGNYGRRNIFTYVYNNESEGFANGVLDVNNEVLKKQKSVISSPYKAILPSQWIRGVDLYKIALWEQTEEKLKSKTTDTYLFSVKRHQMTLQLKYEGVANGQQVVSNFAFLDFAPCNYQNYVDDYYKAFKNLLDKGKKIKATMRLNAIDVCNLDYFKLKYIEQLGAYFYLNKVVFKGKETSVVELIEVGDIVFNAPITDVYNVNKSLYQNTTYVFDWEDFNGYDREDDEVVAVKFVSLPSNVVLKLNDVVITTSTEITKEDLESGHFIAEVPASDVDFSNECHFVLKDAGSGIYSSDTGVLSFVVSGRENTAPVVNAGEDGSATLQGNNAVYYLSGSATDDVSISSVVWSKVEGGSCSINDVNSLGTYVQLHEMGTYKFRLTATDSDGVSAYDEVVITCHTRYTAIYVEVSDIDITYPIRVEGEPNATVSLTARTKDLTAIANGVDIGYNESESFTVVLNAEGKFNFMALLNDISHNNDEYLDITIDSTTDGVLGPTEVTSVRLFPIQ